jgi:hypothetical protein
MINEINTIEDVKLFAYQLVNEESLSFHPDNDFADYINTETKEKSYSEEDIIRLNEMMEKCFIVCEQAELDIYELMGEPLFQKMKIGEFDETNNK